MAGWEQAVGAGVSSAISGAASLFGVNWQQKLQKELMHENESINIRQWERENAYNSPKEQMKRLREAGLNPDLAIAGSVANTSGNAQLTAGTPQAPGAANAVGQAVRNAQDAALIGSQIDLNESAAAKNTSESKNIDVNTEFHVRSMDEKLREIFVRNNFNEQQIKESTERVNEIQMRTITLSKEVENFNDLFRLRDSQREMYRQFGRKASFESSVLQQDLIHYDELFNKRIQLMESEIGLNKAYASNLYQDTRFLIHTFHDRSTIVNNSAFFKTPLDKLHQQQSRYQQALLQYLPYQMADVMFNASKYYKTDKEGNVIYGENGMPELKDGFVAWKFGMEFVNDVTGVLESLANSYKNVAFGTAAFRTGFAPQINVPSAGASSGYDEVYNNYLYKRYAESPAHSSQQQKAYDEWKAYRKKHGK